MYDQNTGEFIPKEKQDATAIANSSQPQKQEAPTNQVTIINNIKQSNGIGTAGFIFALIGFLFSWMPGVGWFIWFLGALLSVIGCFKKPRGLAITGTILSFFDLILLLTVFGALATMFH